MDGGRVADDADSIAEAFVSARRAGSVLDTYPGPILMHLDGGYAVQDAAMRLDARPVGGWKVGRINPPLDGIDRLAGPIFADQIVIDKMQGGNTGPATMSVFRGGFAAAEAEFLLRVGPSFDPTRRRFTNEAAADALDAVHVGIEIASSPFAGINDHGPAVTVSDFGNNNGLVVGGEVPDWRRCDIDAIAVELRVNGTVVGAATTATMLDGPFGAARFLFELMADRGISLAPGQWISTGAVTGVHPVAVGDEVEARFAGLPTVRCVIGTQRGK